MTQPSLLDVRPAPEPLPYQGRSVEACVAGRQAADHAATVLELLMTFDAGGSAQGDA